MGLLKSKNNMSSELDKLDMYRDEFFRIRSLAEYQNSHILKEIVGICNRAILDIDRKSPILEEYERLKTENILLKLELDDLRNIKYYRGESPARSHEALARGSSHFQATSD